MRLGETVSGFQTTKQAPASLNIGLVIELELSAVDEGPDELLERRFGVLFALDVGGGLRRFGGGGEAREGVEIELFDLLAQRPVRLRERRRASLSGGDLV